MIELARFPYFGIDSETDGLRYPINKAFSFSIATPNGYVEYYDLREQPQIIDQINDQMRHYNGKIICHNASFDYRMLLSAGVKLRIELLDDTVIRACQINEHEYSYSLDELSQIYLDKEKLKTIYQELADLYGGLATKNVQMPRLHLAPSSLVGPYCNRDAGLCLELWEWQETEIDKQGLRAICEFEREKMPTFIRTEMRGIRVDLEYAEEARDKMTPVIDMAQKKLEDSTWSDFNVNSGPQIKKLFEPECVGGTWFASDGTTLGTTTKGNVSISADYLREMTHPAAKLILDMRSLIKTRDTFLAKHVIEHAVNGRVYPIINQSKNETGGAGTGRVQYCDPAMGQIPNRNKETAKIIKPCFLPEEGQVWVNTDMASFEVRIFAHLINNPKIIQAYKDNPLVDFHEFVAFLTGLVRNATFSGQANAKQLNLSMIFNSGNGAIAQKMGMPFSIESFVDNNGNKIVYKKAGTAAQDVIDKYHSHIPGVKELAKKCKSIAESRRYLYTYTGRHLRFPRGYKSYKASGILIQATSADANKVNWKIIEETLGNEGSFILNTHDSYDMSLPENWKPLANKVKKNIENGHNFRVPLILNIEGAGKNWWDAISGDN